VLVALRNSGQTLRQALKGLVRVPQKTVNVRLGNVSAKATVQADVQAALAVAQRRWPVAAVRSCARPAPSRWCGSRSRPMTQR
jgi:hypothetical protein